MLIICAIFGTWGDEELPLVDVVSDGSEDTSVELPFPDNNFAYPVESNKLKCRVRKDNLSMYNALPVSFLFRFLKV